MTYSKKGSKIKNFKELNINPERNLALKIIERGLQSIDSYEVVEKCLKLKDRTLFVSGKPFVISSKGKLIIVAVGKCAIDATKAVEKILGNIITRGIVLDVRPNKIFESRNIRYMAGSHPMPSSANVVATKEIIKILDKLSPEDIVLFIISGGGSTLLCLPEGGTCIFEQKIVEELFRVGASIQEINTIRKHMSLGRGGNLAKYAYPAQVISLIFSDVPGNDISFIASGPTVKDITTIANANTILSKYNILQKCSIDDCGLMETPKEEKYFKRVYNIIIVSNKHMLKEMANFAEEAGFSPKICSTSMTGEARDAGKRIAREISESPSKSVFLYGGETTVTIRGKGHGGRNQELALSALEELKNGKLVLTLASDGIDNGPYAGAIADSETRKKAQAQNLIPKEFLENNDSSSFFELTGDYLLTGAIDSNVADLTIAINNF
ncbi:hypothetical protein A3A01_00935 [Candidatus Nomurabacteria bacterium RIFCSPLOWO2_01_FULL_39_17]|uniref:Glycerate kinase n=1 Tax=Candidatus Nomurabacteria bacterium RIFCSPLOWO2_01_FULL_39_17 TaxID=1801770 RepID=A0A1F6WVQ2_9BACT|nr:MAG: hypothetical protein A3A01_00935 [Candidatus Nomurabacteria bacterium RIFCSPLOWO2_01_FULL_39_17]